MTSQKLTRRSVLKHTDGAGIVETGVAVVASASECSEYVIIPRWFTVHHMRGGTLSEAGEVRPMNAVRRSTAARPLERARVPSSSTISAPLLSTR